MENQYVIFTQRAFNTIVTETIDKHPIETGGIFIGYVLDNGAWVVVETIPPGYQTIHQHAYFEYDAEFVNYLSNVIAKQYKGNLQVLGLWHRHPGSMDIFSSTDDETNLTFAREKNCGSISALVNCDPKMRITMYHVNQRGEYTTIDWFIDDGETIPSDFLELHYINEESLPTFNNRGVINECDAMETEVITEPSNSETNNGGEEESTTDNTSETIKEYTFNNAINDIVKIIKKLIR